MEYNGNFYATSEPMHYWATPATMTPDTKRMRLEQMIQDGTYVWSQKIDGNWARAIISEDISVLQTRGISKKTNKYGEIQDKVFFWEDIKNAFQNGTTCILGEIWMDGAIDRDIGSILRCLEPKALARQKDKKLGWYIFDVLALDGQNLMSRPLEERISYIPQVVARINNPLVIGAQYHEMDENFFDDLNDIFAQGGEGAVCYRKSALYIPGKRGPSSWDSVKVKQEISADIDAVITGIEKPTKIYTGKDIENWQYWQNTRTGELLLGDYFSQYRLGEIYEPVTKNYFYNMPGAMFVGVYDKNNKLIPLCKVAGLTDEFKEQLRDNFDEWYLCPVTLGGMMISDARATESGVGISVRHPYLKSIRKDDLNPEDCTLAKILAE